MNRKPPDFSVIIPPDRIALYPASHRAESRLMIVNRKTNGIDATGKFRDIADYLAGDLIVLNDTRVIPARVSGMRSGGGRVELLFLADSFRESDSTITALIRPARRLKSGTPLTLEGGCRFEIIDRSNNGGWHGKWSCVGVPTKAQFFSWLNVFGKPPLPPYIKRQPETLDCERYQTVYAEIAGSLAAPTAGLHWTDELLDDVRRKGAEVVKLTLNVGLGTFEPIKDSDLSRHKMHSETYSIPAETARAINAAKESGRNVTAVGTTVVRALEDAAQKQMPLTGGVDSANLFIYPPFEYKIIDRLLTNFHRPDSTLLQMVAAFTNWELLNSAYQQGVDEGFRFFSYGDAMLIL